MNVEIINFFYKEQRKKPHNSNILKKTSMTYLFTAFYCRVLMKRVPGSHKSINLSGREANIFLLLP